MMISDKKNPERADALLEIGCEELPVDYIDKVNLGIVNMHVDSLLCGALLDFKEITLEATGRRLVFFIRDLLNYQKDDPRVGPPKKVIYDSEGRLSQAGEGFLRKWNLTEKQISFTGKDEKAEFTIPGKPVLDILPEIFPKIFKEFQFPKTMRWETSGARFARPVRWIVALYGKEVIPFTFAGVTSGHRTQLHPMHKNRTAIIPNVSQYDHILDQGQVLLSVDVREEKLQTLLEAEARARGGCLVRDRALLNKVNMMVEWPGLLSGNISEEFMNIPREILITTMREHQRYFAVEDQAGNLLPCFLAVHDNPLAKVDTLRPGCERVLEARLKDAQFFYQEDMKHPLRELVPKLERVLWIKGLGNLLDKSRRLEGLCDWLAEKLEPGSRTTVQEAARLSKADLITNMVQEKEFTSLQGIMGSIYAKEQGHDAVIAQAIREQYLPRWANDALPATPEGKLLSLADKTDHIIGCWGAGFIPTGAKDPYAVRRAVQGLIAVTLDTGYRYSLRALLERALDQFPNFTGQRETTVAQVVDFFQGRLEGELSGRGIAPDLIQAVQNVWWDDLTALVSKTEALHALRTEAGFNEKITTFSRVVNILPKNTPRQLPPEEEDLPVRTELMQSQTEQDLYASSREVGHAVAELSQAGDFRGAFERLSTLKTVVDRFFDDVLVMAEEPEIRENRLNLLTNLARQIWSLADFSKLVVNT